VRVIAASVRDLAKEVGSGGALSRRTCFYRLRTWRDGRGAAPARTAVEDVSLLIRHFIVRNNDAFGHQHPRHRCAPPRKILLGYHWPGNVRELENLIERAVVLAEHDMIMPRTFRSACKSPTTPWRACSARASCRSKKASRVVEEALIRQALTKTRGNRTAGGAPARDFASRIALQDQGLRAIVAARMEPTAPLSQRFWNCASQSAPRSADQHRIHGAIFLPYHLGILLVDARSQVDFISSGYSRYWMPACRPM